MMALAQSTQAYQGQYKVAPSVVVPVKADLSTAVLSACSINRYLRGLLILSSVNFTVPGIMFAAYTILPDE